MAQTKFGSKWWGSASPTYIKLIFYVVFAAFTQFVIAIPDLPVSEIARTWIKIIAGIAAPALAVIRDFFGQQPDPRAPYKPPTE